MIVRALTTFQTDSQMVPGRFNIQEINGVEVILDYGHNAAAMEALGEAVLAMGPRRTVMAFTLPGDRRDEDVADTTKATIPFVDQYVIYDSLDLRGRNPDEIPALMRESLPPGKALEAAQGQREGILRAWQHVQPGDRLIVIADEVGEAMEMLEILAERESTECISPVSEQPAETRSRDKPGFSPA